MATITGPQPIYPEYDREGGYPRANGRDVLDIGAVGLSSTLGTGFVDMQRVGLSAALAIACEVAVALGDQWRAR
jgi:hypothetical protein